MNEDSSDDEKVPADWDFFAEAKRFGFNVDPKKLERVKIVHLYKRDNGDGNAGRKRKAVVESSVDRRKEILDGIARKREDKITKSAEDLLLLVKDQAAQLGIPAEDLMEKMVTLL